MQRHAITDRSLLAPHPGGWEAALTAQVQQWVEGGVEWVQLREKDLAAPALAALARACAELARAPESKTRLVVNGLAPSLALDSGAHGVHLRSGVTEREIRAVSAVCELVSVSCHTLEEAAIARSAGATCILWAPVFGKVAGGVSVHAGTGLPALAAACRHAAPVSVFALGGVTSSNANSCIRAGAAGVAGIRLFHGQHWRDLK